jgi:benzodiazapine receptor
MKKKVSIKKLIISLGLPLLMGALSGFFASQTIPMWYEKLHQPSFRPPNWLFAPVWIVLYLLMGISLYLIWRLRVSRERNMALVAFVVQLLLNFGWSFLFFSSNMIGLAFVEILALWASIILMLLIFYKIKPVASYLNIPYFFWVTFAAVLNALYFTLN